MWILVVIYFNLTESREKFDTVTSIYITQDHYLFVSTDSQTHTYLDVQEFHLQKIDPSQEKNH